MQLGKLSEIELLKLNSATIDELMRRNVVRTRNGPIGDFAEWLVAKSMNLTLAKNSKAGYDAESEAGVKFQIKSRIVTKSNNSRQLSAIRKYEAKDFDYLIGIIFNTEIEILEAVQIPYAIVGNYASYKEHINGHILRLKGAVLRDPEIMHIKDKLTENISTSTRKNG